MRSGKSSAFWNFFFTVLKTMLNFIHYKKYFRISYSLQIATTQKLQPFQVNGWVAFSGLASVLLFTEVKSWQIWPKKVINFCNRMVKDGRCCSWILNCECSFYYPKKRTLSNSSNSIFKYGASTFPWNRNSKTTLSKTQSSLIRIRQDWQKFTSYSRSLDNGLEKSY